MQSLTIYHWLIILAVVGVTLAGSKFMQKKVWPAKTPGQRRLERFGVPLSVVWVVAYLWFGDMIKDGRITSGPALAAGVIGCALLGLAMVFWYWRWLREADELVRRMETEAMAIGLGLATIGMVAAQQLERAGASFFVHMSKSTPGGLAVLLLFFGSGIARFVVHARYR